MHFTIIIQCNSAQIYSTIIEQRISNHLMWLFSFLVLDPKLYGTIELFIFAR